MVGVKADRERRIRREQFQNFRRGVSKAGAGQILHAEMSARLGCHAGEQKKPLLGKLHGAGTVGGLDGLSRGPLKLRTPTQITFCGGVLCVHSAHTPKSSWSFRAYA